MIKSCRSDRNEALGSWVAALAVCVCASGTAVAQSEGAGTRYVRTNESGLPASDAFVLGQGATAVGYDARAINQGSLALGQGAEAGAFDSIAVGTGAAVELFATQGIAIGQAARVSSESSVAIGGSAIAEETNLSAIAIGPNAAARQGRTAIAIGAGAATSGPARTGGEGEGYVGDQLALGASAVASDVDATAVGARANASRASALALGVGTTASHEGSVALGTGSVSTGAMLGNQAYLVGGTALSEVSIGSAGAERRITNVAAGSSDTDAVNVSQLRHLRDSIGNVAGLKYFQANSTQADARASGAESTAMGPQAAAIGNGAVAAGDRASASGAGSVALGRQSTATSNGGVALGADAVADRAGMNGQREAVSNVAVGSAQGAVSVGSAGQERQITHVAGGTQATDAVNVRQLEAARAGSVRYDSHPDGSTDYRSVTLGSGHANGGTTVSNLAPGVAGTDAVNVDQLNSGIANARRYTDAKLGELRSDIDQTTKDASAGIAGAMAMANLPQPVLPGKSLVSAGVAGFDGQAALAVGVSKLSDNGRWIVKFSGTANSRGKVGVAAGMGFHW